VLIGILDFPEVAAKIHRVESMLFKCAAQLSIVF
jgi:hypothetical protein